MIPLRHRGRSVRLAVLRPLASCLVAGLALAAPGLAVQVAATADQTLLLRYPDIHRDFVVFVYAGDLWRASAAGGDARRLTSHPGLEIFPSISSDGKWIAYSAEYTGTRQVYVIPAEGGSPRQLSFYNDVGPMPPRGGFDNWVLGWSADGKILVRMNRTPFGVRKGRYFLVDPEGGLETALPIQHGGSASFSPDGGQLAFTPVDREFRTWKRTRGGRAQEIWIHDLGAGQTRRLTDSPATDNFPMWTPGGIYFTSDRAFTLNLFRIAADGSGLTQLTQFDEYDVLWPAAGPDAIVFMNGGGLHRFDRASGETSAIPIRIRADFPDTVPHFLDVEDDVAAASPSPSGARVVVEARGELFTVPAENGATRNLTNSQGVREHSPSWSPDGSRIAYLSDASGEYEIYVRAQDGSGEARRLTHDGDVWKLAPHWSPDGKSIAYGDRKRRLYVLDAGSGRSQLVDTGWLGDLDHYVWSPDSRWLAYETAHEETRLQAIALYSLEDRKRTRLGDGLTNDYEPRFGADGHTLFFLSDRDFNIRFSAFEFDYLYDRATRVYAAALDASTPALFPPRSDEEDAEGEKDDDGDGDGDGDEASETEPLRLEAVGFVQRTIALPDLPSGNYADLSAVEGAVFYRRQNDDGQGWTLYRFDLEEREEAEVMAGVRGYELTADGKKLLYRTGHWGLAEANAGQKSDEGSLDFSALRVKIDPRAEWAQMFQDAWRISRDWFYDPGMHGLDWKAIGERYGRLVPHVSHRADLDFLFGEMIGELEAGHCYVQRGDMPEIERVEGGMLGCEFEADRSGRYRIARIFPGENWEPGYRSPLTEPGVDVREGEFLLAIDGQELTTSENPYRLLENKAEVPVVLKLGTHPDGRDARELTVISISDEGPLRYLAWVKSRMALADRLSAGRVGYVHLPDTAIEGNRMLQKLFYGQANKEALIIDDRYNGGGFIPDRMIEMLSRRTKTYWAQRDIDSFRTPGFAHDGPKAMLINGYAASGGDALPYYFRQAGLGPLIGTRTWGGLIGISGAPDLADGGTVLVPTFRIYDPDGKWVVENEGVAPDVEIHDLPESWANGGDPCVEKAVEMLLEELHRGGTDHPAIPKPPAMNRRGER